MKVYNKGTKPIVYKRSFDGVQAIHPKKYLTFGEDEGKKLIKKFENAVDEKEWESLQKKKKVK